MQPLEARTQVGVRVATPGAAVVSVLHRNGSLTVTDVQRFPYDLAAVAGAVEYKAQQPETSFMVDGEGIGAALWSMLGHQHDDGWRLYRDQGRDRQVLSNALALAYSTGKLRFAADLDHRAALDHALASFNPMVGDDGIVGGELVVALALAVYVKPKLGGFAFVAAP